jgi:hypothetical protein
MISHRPANNPEFDQFLPDDNNGTQLDSRPELYFCVKDWHLSMNACRSVSFLKVGSAACIPVPEQFVEFTSGVPSPPQLIKVALRAITNTIYLEFINSSSLQVINMAADLSLKCNNSGCLV